MISFHLVQVNKMRYSIINVDSCAGLVTPTNKLITFEFPKTKGNEWQFGHSVMQNFGNYYKEAILS